MTKTTANLDTFDFLELLFMLSEGGRTGVLTVERGVSGELFQAWLQEGRVTSMLCGEVRGVSALTALLSDPRGAFNFAEGEAHPEPDIHQDLGELALAALAELPVPELTLQGPARLTDPERLARMPWSLSEHAVLRAVEQGQPLSELSASPEAARLLARLVRLGLISPRRSRVARLTVELTREVRGTAVIDEKIVQRWRDDLGRAVLSIAVRDGTGAVHQFPVTGSASAGVRVLLPAELMVVARIQGGDVVLVQPI